MKGYGIWIVMEMAAADGADVNQFYPLGNSPRSPKCNLACGKIDSLCNLVWFHWNFVDKADIAAAVSRRLLVYKLRNSRTIVAYSCSIRNTTFPATMRKIVYNENGCSGKVGSLLAMNVPGGLLYNLLLNLYPEPPRASIQFHF